MPWKVGDVDKHKKDLTDEQKEVWVKVANGALARCEKKGGSDCEASAIRQANAVVERAGKEAAYEEWFGSLDEDTLQLIEDHEHGLKSALIKERAARKDLERQLAEATKTDDGKEYDEAEIMGHIVPLVEKATAPDGTIPIKIMQPGWGTSGYYSPELLERDGPKLFKAGTQMFIDHPTESEERERPERSVRDLAGELVEDAAWDPVNAFGPGLYSKAKPVGEFAGVLDQLAPHIGLSINARGRAKEGKAEGKEGMIIQEITAARSVDFVTVPGAGGKILELYEAARKGTPRKETSEEGDMPDEKALKEAQDALVAEKKARGELETENARLKEVIVLGKAKAFVSEKLAEQEIPELTRTRLAESLSKDPPVKDGELDEKAFETKIAEAVKAEVDYLAKLTGSGDIKGLGGSEPPEGDAEGLKKLTETWKDKYEAEGYDAETAEKMAKISVRGG